MTILYHHTSGSLYCPDSGARSSYYGVGGVPDCYFDGVLNYVGGGSGTYSNYKSRINSRLAVPAPVTIESRGAIDETSGWVTALITATQAISYTNLRVQFVLYENYSPDYPWIVRDMLPVQTVTLSAPGDTVTVHRSFTVSGAWDHEAMRQVVLLENTAPKQILNSQLVPNAYDLDMVTDDNALQTPVWGTAEFTTIVKNEGSLGDTIDLAIDISQLPAGWDGVFCIGPVCYTEKDIYLEAGQSETVEVHISAADQTEVGVAMLDAASRGNLGAVMTEYYGTFVNTPEIMIVDDDNGAGHEAYLETALSDAGYPTWVWDADAIKRPTISLLSSCWAVFWTTADGDCTYLTGEDEASMVSYLNAGGNFCLASMDYLSSRMGPSQLRDDYLMIAGYLSNNGGSPMSGVTGDPITDGMSLDLSGGPFSDGNSDALLLAAPSDTIFTSPTGYCKALRVEQDSYKAVFLAFPFECVSTSDSDPNNQKTLADKIVLWFGPEVGVDDEILAGAGRLALEQNFPNPFNPATMISFVVPRESGQVEIVVYDVRGRRVRTLVDGSMTPGEHSVVWDGKDDAGVDAASGVYFCKLSAGSESALRKMALLK